MGDVPVGVRGALAQARLAIARAEQRPRRKSRQVVPEDDAFTRDEIVAARGDGGAAA